MRPPLSSFLHCGASFFPSCCVFCYLDFKKDRDECANRKKKKKKIVRRHKRQKERKRRAAVVVVGVEKRAVGTKATSSLQIEDNFFSASVQTTTPTMASVHTPCTARPRPPSSRGAARMAARQCAKARPVSTSAAAPKRANDSVGGGETPSPTRNTAAAASATADFAVSCPWPRPPSFPDAYPSEQALPIKRKAALFFAKVRARKKKNAPSQAKTL